MQNKQYIRSSTLHLGGVVDLFTLALCCFLGLVALYVLAAIALLLPMMIIGTVTGVFLDGNLVNQLYIADAEVRYSVDETGKRFIIPGWKCPIELFRVGIIFTLGYLTLLRFTYKYGKQAGETRFKQFLHQRYPQFTI